MNELRDHSFHPVDRRSRLRSHERRIFFASEWRRSAAVAVVSMLLAGAARGAPGVATTREPSDELAPAPASNADERARDPQVDDEGRRLYQEGLRAFVDGNYGRAIERLETAYARAPAPALLYDLGQAHRLQGDCAHALSFYRRFLDTNPGGHPRERTESRIAEMERCVAAAPAAPTPHPLPVVPAPAPAPSHPVTQSPAPALSLTPSLAIAAGAPPGAAFGLDARGGSDHRARRRQLALGLGATAAVLASVSGYFAWRAASASDRVSASFVPMRSWTAADRSAEDTGILSDRLAIGTGVGALLAAGVGAWSWWQSR